MKAVLRKQVAVERRQLVHFRRQALHIRERLNLFRHLLAQTIQHNLLVNRVAIEYQDHADQAAHRLAQPKR